MVVAQLRVLNLTGHDYELTLNPWRDWVVLPPRGTVRIRHELPSHGWAELDVSEWGALYHGWDGHTCELTIGEGPSAERRSLRAPARPAILDANRPKDLVAWATALPERYQRLRVDDYRAQPRPLVVIGPKGEIRHTSGPLLMSADSDSALELVLRADGDTTVRTSEGITIHSRRR